MLILPKNYRFKVLNALGQTISAGNITVKCIRFNIDSTGAVVYEGSEATVLSNAGTLATATYLAGTAQDNSTTKWLGGDFTFKVVAPASSSGPVTLFLERSSDGGTTFDDDGLGIPVARLDFTTSGTKVVTFSL